MNIKEWDKKRMRGGKEEKKTDKEKEDLQKEAEEIKALFLE